MTTYKHISYDSQKITNGVNAIVNVVAATLGPNGKNVGIISGSKVLNTKDGVTVAKKCLPFKDQVENYAAQIVKRAADQAVEKAGDGTTTTCVLTQAIYLAAKQLLQSKNLPTATFCRELSLAAQKVLALMPKYLVHVDDKEFVNVINISTNGDSELTNIIVEAFKRVGKDGIISIEPAQGKETTLEKVDGLCFDTGFISPYFITNPDKMNVIYEGTADGKNMPYILLYDGVLSSADTILHILDGVVKERRPLLIIAEDVTGECLSTLIVNRMRAGVPFVAVKTPGYGDAKKNWLHDIAAVTGAKVIDPKLDDIKECGLNILGTAKKIVVDNKETTIVGSQSESDTVKSYIANLEQYLSTETEDFYKEKAQERIARLKQGVTIIKLAAFNDVESQEKSDRIDDAIKAGRAALKEGLVSGCGTALYKQIPSLDTNSPAEEVLAEALSAPVKMILSNAGYSETAIRKLLDSINYGSDQAISIANGEATVIDNYITAGIVDPYLVVSTALEEAVAAASLLVNTAATIVDEDEKCECNH